MLDLESLDFEYSESFQDTSENILHTYVEGQPF